MMAKSTKWSGSSNESRFAIVLLALLTFGCYGDANPPAHPSRANLDALELFNATLGRHVAREIPKVRVFVGVQEGDAAETDAYAWTRCIEESHVFVVQVAHRTLGLGLDQVRYAAAHEAAHLILHRQVLCGGGYTGLPKVRKMEIEREADYCASILIAGGSC